MRRREFITLLGGAVAWPIGAEAQLTRTPVLGFLASASEARYTVTVAAVRRGLNEAGLVEKQNLLIEYRWADFQYERKTACACGRLSQTSGRRHLCNRERSIRDRRQVSHGEHSDRVRQW